MGVAVLYAVNVMCVSLLMCRCMSKCEAITKITCKDDFHRLKLDMLALMPRHMAYGYQGPRLFYVSYLNT